MLTFFTTRIIFLIKAIALFIFFFISHAWLWSAPYTKWAQEESSIFNESDLADIEGGDTKEPEEDLLEKEFESLDQDESDNNFDPQDFELEPDLEEDSLEPQDNEEELKELDGSNKDDYEIISDREGYEIISDEELETEFEESTEDTDDEASGDIDDEDSIEGDLQDLEDIPEEDDSFTEDSEFMDEDSEDELSLEEEDSTEEDEMTFEEEDSTEEDEMTFEEEDSQEDDSIEAPQPDSDESSYDMSLNLITNIRYVAEKDQIIISAKEPPSYEDRLNEETNQLVIEILQSQLSKNLGWPFILRDFKTGFGLLQADQKNKTTVRVVIQLREGAERPPISLTDEGEMLIGKADDSMSSLEESELDNELQADILPAKTLEDLYFGDIKFSGSPMSFHVIDADIKQVLRFISEESGLNMVIDEGVQGGVTLKLEDVPWDQALYTLFKVKSLGYTRNGNVITILPLQKIESRTQKLQDIAERQKAMIPMETKVIPIMYLKVTEIEGKLKEFLSKPVRGAQMAGGRILVNESNNTLVVIDRKENIKKIESMAKFLDKPPQQVMVESKIVEVSKNFARNYGFNWGLSGDLPVSINASGLLDFVQSFFDQISGSWRVSEKGQSNTFNLSGIPLIGDIEASLSLAETDGMARVLNTAKIFVRSGKPASINKNTPIRIPVTNTASVANEVQNQGSTTETFQNLDITFDTSITPTVTSSGSIALNVSINLSDPGPGGAGEPVSINRTATTEVLAKNGQTVVVSGIYQKSESQGEEGTPFLRRIPILKYLFGNREISKAESEMLMFVTPTLVED